MSTNLLRFQGEYFERDGAALQPVALLRPTSPGLSPDPIGLLGGLNEYQYAPNPVLGRSMGIDWRLHLHGWNQVGKSEGTKIV